MSWAGHRPNASVSLEIERSRRSNSFRSLAALSLELALPESGVPLEIGPNLHTTDRHRNRNRVT